MSTKRKQVFRVVRGVVMLAALSTGASCHAGTVISEFFYDAAGSDNGLVFVELFGTPGTLLDGILLEGINGGDGAVYRTVALAGLIPADGFFVIGDDRGDGISLVANVDLVAEVDFQNGPDSIVLRSDAGVLDALGYGDFSTSVFAGEGQAADDVPAGFSLARIDARLDSNDNRVDFTMLASPTPGSMEVTAVPLPPALVLFMSGIAGLVSVGRRMRG